MGVGGICFDTVSYQKALNSCSECFGVMRLNISQGLLITCPDYCAGSLKNCLWKAEPKWGGLQKGCELPRARLFLCVALDSCVSHCLWKGGSESPLQRTERSGGIISLVRGTLLEFWGLALGVSWVNIRSHNALASFLYSSINQGQGLCRANVGRQTLGLKWCSKQCRILVAYVMSCRSGTWYIPPFFTLTLQHRICGSVALPKASTAYQIRTAYGEESEFRPAVPNLLCIRTPFLGTPTCQDPLKT